jgi:hypothetical protein
MGEMEPIDHRNVTVNGSAWRKSDPWNGLDFSRAVVRERSTLMVAVVGTADAPPDHHLDVPWCHPDDQPQGWKDGCWYRVRPRKKRMRFVKDGDEWKLGPSG